MEPRDMHRRSLGRSAIRWCVPVALVASGVVGLGPAAGATTKPRGKPAVVVDAAQRAKLGVVLVTARGMTLYHFTSDTSRRVACTGGCTHIWPPLVLPAGVVHATAGRGVTGLGTVRDPGGKLQVTWHGEPLYLFSGDKRAGQTNGEGILNKWFVVRTTSVAGTKKKSAPPTTARTGSGY